jgi:hypothetical protein
VTGYQPDFDIDFRRGMVGEDTHRAFLFGTHEVKTDYRVAETGNLYVETRQQNERGEFLSGINTSKADWWAFVSPWGRGGVYIQADVLRAVIAETNPRETRQPIRSETSNSSTGRLVRLDDILRALGMR